MRHQNSPFLAPESDDPVSRAIKANPCLLDNLQAVDFDRMWPEDPEWEQLKTALVLTIAAPLLAPVLEAAGVMGVLTSYAEAMVADLGANEVRRRLGAGAVGFSIDVAIQTAMIYYFPPQGQDITIREALSKVNYKTASASAAEAMVSLDIADAYSTNPILAANVQLITTGAFSCFIDGHFRSGKGHEKHNPENCEVCTAENNH